MARRRGQNRSTGRRAGDPRPFDATTKHLLEADPVGWLRNVGLPAVDPVTVVDADLSTVLAEADKVVRIAGSAPRLVHVEMQAGYDAAMPARLLQYNALLHRRHGLPVASTVVLLRPEADGPALSGTFELTWEGEPYLTFAYRVVRAWERPVDAVLAGSLGTLPLAPIADVAPGALPSVLRRMGERAASEAAPDEAATLWAATFLLAALRYPPEEARMIRSLSQAMRESWAYQEILDEGRAEGRAEGEARGRAEGEARGRAEGEARGRAEGEARGRAEGEARGRAEEARRVLTRLGTRRLGQPDAVTTASLTELNDVERIERMIDRLLDATSWAEVLATP